MRYRKVNFVEGLPHWFLERTMYLRRNPSAYPAANWHSKPQDRTKEEVWYVKWRVQRRRRPVFLN